MKKIRILSLLLAALFVLTCFSGTFAFADEDTDPDEPAATDTDDPDTDEPDTDEPDTDDPDADDPDGEDPNTEDGVVIVTPEAFQAVDPTLDENSLILASAEKAAGGRAVTVYAITLAAADFRVQTIQDFVGVCSYNAEADEMTLLEPYYSGALTMYDLSARTDLDGATGYVLEVSSIPDAEIAALPDMEVPDRLAWKLNKRGLFKSEEQRIRAMTKYYEEGDLVLYADDELAEIALYNKAADQYYFSTPYNYRRVAGVNSNDTRKALASVVALTYYDNSANEKVVYSFTDAVEKTSYADPSDKDAADNIQFTSEKIDKGVRFNLNVGTQTVDALLPYAAVAENFETKVLGPVKAMEEQGNEVAARAMRKLNAYYTLYKYSELKASLKASIERNYPGIRDYDLYILRPVSDREKKFLSDYIKMSGLYTWSDWNLDLELSGYEPEDVALACFDIKVDFTIENGDLVVNMPTENIKYDDTHFTLASATLMHYFGCGNASDGGFTFIPDGSGSVIKFNSDGRKTSTSMIKRVYGDDYSLTTNESYKNLMQAAYLPVYGLYTKERGYLAIVEKGDAMATITSESGGSASPFETAYTTMIYRTVQRISYNDSSKQNGSFTYYNDNIYADGFRLRYKLFHGPDKTYVDMAKIYRQYLLDNGLLQKKVDAGSSVPLVLETLGLIDKKASFLGIIYNKKIPLTTFEDAQAMMEELNAGGVANISLRYRGWMNGGLNYSVPSKISIESKLGGKSGFRDLISYTKGKNFTLFPEVDFRVVRRDGFFDGYTTTSNAPKMTDRTTVTLTPRNELDNVQKIDKNYFAISPTSTEKYFKSFFGKFADYDLSSVSIGTVGNMLFSDFSSGSSAAHRQRAMEILGECVDGYVPEGTRLMVEGGNAYTYRYATDIVDIPLCDSNTFLADEAVPFMQIVLHGHIQYAGVSLNLADDWMDTILKSAEYGANLHFTLSAENTRELKDTVYANYFTIDFDTWKNDVLKEYERFNKVFATLQDQEIQNHEKAADGVYITTYANGTRIAVNYNRASVTVEGKTIGAQDFTVL